MNKDVKIVFMGTPSFSAKGLEALVNHGYHPAAVYTQPDRINGRGKKINISPVKEFALNHDIPVEQPKTLRTEEAIEHLKSYHPDLLIVIAYGQILPQEVLDIPQYGAVNVHASLLPKYRGAAPIQRAILNGDKETGITIMKLDAGMDTGDMLLQKKVEIPSHITSGELFNLLSNSGSDALLEFMDQFPEILTKAVPQNPELATYAEKLTKPMGQIQWDQPAQTIDRLIRAFNPDPGAFSFFRGKRIKIHQAFVSDDVSSDGLPGAVVSTDKGRVYVQTGDGVLALETVQPENHKKMNVKDFINGYQVKPNDQFGK